MLNIKHLKEIIMNLDDSYQVLTEDQDRLETIPIKSVKIFPQTKEVILKNW